MSQTKSYDRITALRMELAMLRGMQKEKRQKIVPAPKRNWTPPKKAAGSGYRVNAVVYHRRNIVVNYMVERPMEKKPWKEVADHLIELGLFQGISYQIEAISRDLNHLSKEGILQRSVQPENNNRWVYWYDPENTKLGMLTDENSF